jgi:hypothetical protein
MQYWIDKSLYGSHVSPLKEIDTALEQRLHIPNSNASMTDLAFALETRGCRTVEQKACS